MEIALKNDNAIIPTRASKESAGLDLYSSIDIDIEVGLIKKVNTGICISLPENSYGFIRDKSSLASKVLLTLGGVIDSDYTGEIIFVHTNNIHNICAYLMNICCERYFKLSPDEYLKIKKFIDNNIDITESTLAPMNDYFDLYKKFYNRYYYSCYYYH